MLSSVSKFEPQSCEKGVLGLQIQDSDDRKPIMNWLFSGKSWVFVCGAIFIGAGLSRFLFLSEKPFHHDESLHAYYSSNIARGHTYEYSALLHGPVLYYFVGAFMAIFGMSDFLARFPAAFCSVVLVILPLFWHRSIGKAASAALSVLFLLSPTFMYFGRFLREDAFNSLWIGCSLGGFFAYHWWGKPWHAVVGTIFLAMQFCNKENSYLHVFVWLTGIAVMLLFFKRDEKVEIEEVRGTHYMLTSKTEKLALLLNCIFIFAIIFVIFYSSFFRHSKGALHGVLDGLYRESLIYWWEQNRQRRIDGPFDYHFPILFNYEFAIVPLLVTAWLRSVNGAYHRSVSQTLKFPFQMFQKRRSIMISALVLLSLLFLPRVGLTREGCNIAEYCADTAVSADMFSKVSVFAKALHVSHTRHLIQITNIALLGALAFMANVRLRRFLDGFLWWWATGALGIYSYVGEKVPWLLIYILLPLIALAGLEVGRLLGARPTLRQVMMGALPFSEQESLFLKDQALNSRYSRWVLATTMLLLCFSAWKALRVSFPDAANPEERLIFTQTTPSMKAIRERWVEVRQQKRASPKVAMSGDATWPMAWYTHDLPGVEFIRPANAASAALFDAFFLDTADLAFARKEFQTFDIYEVPLRHWWVPQANPRPDEMIEYFLTRRPYPRELRESPSELGLGHAAILYLENKDPARIFADVGPCHCGERIQEAEFLQKNSNSGF